MIDPAISRLVERNVHARHVIDRASENRPPRSRNLSPVPRDPDETRGEPVNPALEDE